MWDYFLCLRLLCWSNNYKQRSSLHLHWFILRQKTYSLKSRCPYPSVWEKERGKYEKRLNDSLSNFTNLSSAILVFFLCVCLSCWMKTTTDQEVHHSAGLVARFPFFFGWVRMHMPSDITHVNSLLWNDQHAEKKTWRHTLLVVINMDTTHVSLFVSIWKLLRNQCPPLPVLRSIPDNLWFSSP